MGDQPMPNQDDVTRISNVIFEGNDNLLLPSECDDLTYLILAAIGDRLLPTVPDYIKRLTITTAHWNVDFYTHAFPNDNGQIWEDANGDDQAVAFSILASVCEIPGIDEWSEWDCYPEDFGWLVFADNDGETGHPQGTGPTIPAAIRDALEADHG